MAVMAVITTTGIVTPIAILASVDKLEAEDCALPFAEEDSVPDAGVGF